MTGQETSNRFHPVLFLLNVRRVSDTNGDNNFALVRRQPDALEKAHPGAKRILSGMVADTLALVRRKPCLTILVGSGCDWFERGLKANAEAYFDITFRRFKTAEELLRLAEELFDWLFPFFFEYAGEDEKEARASALEFLESQTRRLQLDFSTRHA